jgi:type IV pilus assembly protein PilN
MIRINLLPIEVQTTERKINPTYIAAGVGGVLMIFLLPFHMVQYSKRKHLQDEITSLQSELDRYKPIVAQVEALEAAKAQLQQRKTIIQQLESERLRYPYFMEDFLKLLPSHVWLTSLSTTLLPDGASISVNMDVIALDNYAVADMVSNLETSQIFSDVNLGSITSNQSATAQAITFHVSTTYRKAALNTNAPKKS